MHNVKLTNSASALVFFACIASVVGCKPSDYTTVPLPSKSKKAAATNNAPSTGPDTAAGNSTDTDGDKKPLTTASATPAATATPANRKIGFDPNVPNADDLRKCMNLWGSVPFTQVKASQVKVMDVSVGVGGGLLGSSNPIGGVLGTVGSFLNIGNPKDLEATVEPRLIVIPLSVNLGGNVTFELMNPNGWYCMKAAVGAKSTLNIKLHCTAKLAQSDLGISLDTKPAAGSPLPVNVGINDGKTPGGQLGIMVDSSVNLTRMGVGGAACAP